MYCDVLCDFSFRALKNHSKSHAAADFLQTFTFIPTNPEGKKRMPRYRDILQLNLKHKSLIPILVSLDVDDLHDLREDHVNEHEDREPEHVV